MKALLIGNRDESKTNLSSTSRTIFENSMTLLNGSSSAKSNLRADILRLKEEHLRMNLDKSFATSSSKFLHLSTEDKDRMTNVDRYDIEAFEFKQYFP